MFFVGQRLCGVQNGIAFSLGDDGDERFEKNYTKLEGFYDSIEELQYPCSMPFGINQETIFYLSLESQKNDGIPTDVSSVGVKTVQWEAPTHSYNCD